MAKISAYVVAGPLDGNELLDISQPDVTSGTGFTTKSLKLEDLIAYIDVQTLYTNDSQLAGNRIVDQDGNYLVFEGNGAGYFQVDGANEGLYYDYILRQMALGHEFPIAKLDILNHNTDDIARVRNSLGVKVLEIEDSGAMTFGNGANVGWHHFYSENDNGTYFDGNSDSASAYILKCRNSTDEVFRVRGNGQIDLATNGAKVVIGNGTSTAQFHQLSPTASGSALGIHIVESATIKCFEIKANGRVLMPNLPTSAAGLSAGDLWNNAGVVNIV